MTESYSRLKKQNIPFIQADEGQSDQVCLAALLGGRRVQDAVDPLGVVGDDGVDPRLLHLTTLPPAVGGDAHCDAVVEQRASRVSLRQRGHG